MLLAMRPPGTAEQLEKRRRRAVQLLEAGKSLFDVARQVGASESSVFRRWETYQRHGWQGLRSKPTPGRPSGLSPTQKQRLVRLLTKGPLHVGYPTDLWTLGRVAELIAHEFDIRYRPAHV